MAAKRANAGARLTKIAAQHQEGCNLLHVPRALGVLRNPHAVADNGGVRLDVGIGDTSQISSREPARLLDVRPRCLAQIGLK